MGANMGFSMSRSGRGKTPDATRARRGAVVAAAVLGGALAFSAGASDAQAALMIQVTSSGGGSASVTDGGTGDLLPGQANAITMISSLGGFQITIETGVSN